MHGWGFCDWIVQVVSNVSALETILGKHNTSFKKWNSKYCEYLSVSATHYLRNNFILQMVELEVYIFVII